MLTNCTKRVSAIKHLYWFSHDLRIQDNLALALAAAKATELELIYIFDPRLIEYQQWQSKAVGKHQQRFIEHSLIVLNDQLQVFGQHLKVYYGHSEKIIARYLIQNNFAQVHTSVAIGSYEQKLQSKLIKQFGDRIVSTWQHTLFEQNQLPFAIDDIAKTFSSFRKHIEKAKLAISTCCKISHLPPPASKASFNLLINNSEQASQSLAHLGGCASGEKHLTDYFDSDAALSYKATRNELDNWQSSTKFSLWLAHGCLSPRQIWHALKAFEKQRGSNESTYWIGFELLWREYFHWLLLKFGNRFFHFAGINDKAPLTSFHGERFQKWCHGSTPYPIINACMKQLKATGYLSNRGRQLVASCLVNELQLDWRYGAAYFQEMLIDYDVASNWGNWQYLAGVGADPRGGRWFNLEKQQQMYDPDEHFTNHWGGYNEVMPLDSININDWPIS